MNADKETAPGRRIVIRKGQHPSVQRRKKHMRELISNHWCNHDELLRRLAKNPGPYLSLAYWVGRNEHRAPVFFITPEKPPKLALDPRFSGWSVGGWRRLSHPAEAESILTQWDDQTTRGHKVKVAIDVHWYIQFDRTDRNPYGEQLPDEEEDEDEVAG
jgi:hypothetical protein